MPPAAQHARHVGWRVRSTHTPSDRARQLTPVPPQMTGYLFLCYVSRDGGKHVAGHLNPEAL
jgi:hypothetical protein